MFIPRNAKLRHKILKELLKADLADDKSVSLAEETAITVVDLAEKLNTTPDRIKQACSLMQKDDVVKFDDFGNGECLYAWNASATYLFERTYLKQGLKERNDGIYDVVKWALPLMAIGVSLWTAILNIQLSNNKSKVQKEIDSIKQELSTLKVKESKETHTTQLSDSVSYRKP